MELLAKIDEQRSSRFSGKINVLKKENGQFLAAVFLVDGRVVGGSYQQRTGENALFSMLCDGLGQGMRYIVEPEVISDRDQLICLTAGEIQKELRLISAELPRLKGQIPPLQLHLLICSAFIIEGAELGLNQFDILTTISDYSKVEDIYRFSPYHVGSTTRALVSLRKMGALKVIKP
ncbi:MAG: hypothetical protein KAG61_07885 [Bacteriovoracaceae bacterium]|nr:hypothetical protein [Bacteriovoracaceae bacterium]